MQGAWPRSLVLLLVFAAGCANSRWGFINRPRDPAPPSGPPPSKEAVVAYLNDNAARLQTLRSDDLDITVQQGALPIGLRGKMMTQKPRGFRMSGDLAGNRVVDLGSNDQEFWWWISKSDPPDQYFCRYSDLNEGRISYLPFPFQPEWIMETLGMGPYGPADKYQLDEDRDMLRLTERSRSPQGRMVRKVIVMKRAPQKAPNPQVLAYLLLDDASGAEICSAEIMQVDVDHGTGAIVPRVVDLRWPEAKVKLSLKLGQVAVNDQLPQTAFERPVLQGVHSRDLAQLRFAPTTNVQRVQGFGGP